MMSEEIMEFVAVNENTSGFCCFPNPTNGEIFIQLPEGSLKPQKIEIYNMLGQKIFSTVFEANGSSVSIHPDMAPGLYVLKIGDQMQRIVKQ